MFERDEAVGLRQSLGFVWPRGFRVHPEVLEVDQPHSLVSVWAVVDDVAMLLTSAFRILGTIKFSWYRKGVMEWTERRRRYGKTKEKNMKGNKEFISLMSR